MKSTLPIVSEISITVVPSDFSGSNPDSLVDCPVSRALDRLGLSEEGYWEVTFSSAVYRNPIGGIMYWVNFNGTPLENFVFNLVYDLEPVDQAAEYSFDISLHAIVL